jgi:hypothetical protein
VRPERFIRTFEVTNEQIAQAIEQADAIQLAKALDPVYFDRNIRPNGPRFWCPVCGTHGAHAIDRWRWRCDACPHGGRTGSWLALRQPVAEDTEACIRIARFVHGERVLGGAA